MDPPEANGKDGPYSNGPNPKNAFGDLPGQCMGNSISQKTVHSAGANWLATDGHVKFLMPGAVSGGYDPTINATDPQIIGGGKYRPAGIATMTDGLGSKFVLTFSEN